MVLQSYLSEVNQLIGRQLEVDANDISRHLYVNPLLPYPLVENLTPSEFAVLLESFPVESPVQVYVSNMRHYPYENAAGHALGYVGQSPSRGRKRHARKRAQDFRYQRDLWKEWRKSNSTRYCRARPGPKSGWSTQAAIKLTRQANLSGKKKKGRDITLSIDIDLQLAGESGYDLYQDKGALRCHRHKSHGDPRYAEQTRLRPKRHLPFYIQSSIRRN